MTETRPIQHVVLFDFPEPPSAADDAHVRDTVASWDERIGLARECRIGSDISGRAGAWDYLLYTVFDDERALQAYVRHPVHQEFVAWLDERQVTRAAFDYPL